MLISFALMKPESVIKKLTTVKFTNKDFEYVNIKSFVDCFNKTFIESNKKPNFSMETWSTYHRILQDIPMKKIE